MRRRCPRRTFLSYLSRSESAVEALLLVALLTAAAGSLTRSVLTYL